MLLLTLDEAENNKVANLEKLIKVLTWLIFPTFAE